MQNEKTLNPKQTTANPSATKPSPEVTVTTNKHVSVFNSIDEQEIRQLVQETGIYLRGAVEPWKMNEGQKNETSGISGWIQLLKRSSQNNSKLKIELIKVREDQFGIIDILNQSKELKPVVLDCEISTYGNKSSIYLVPDQSQINLGLS